jgi:uncharacterized membrane protein YciS (DUF1049 family)
MPFLSATNTMKWLSRIITALIVTVVMAAGVVLAILNPQIITINLWGWVTLESTVAAWSLSILALGIVVGVLLASLLILKLQSQLYASQRKLLQLHSMPHTKEIKK